MANIYTKQQAIDLIARKKAKIYSVRNSKTDADTQRLCVNELSRLNKLMKKVTESDDDVQFSINIKPDIFEFSM